MFLAAACLIVGCEEEYIPASNGQGPRYVVEGFIEAGENPFPTYVLLTRTFEFYSELGPQQFTDAFVHDAMVTVSHGTQEFALQEVCFSDLPMELRNEIAGQFGFNGDSLQVDFCVYVDLLRLLQPVIGGTYNLKIQIDDDLITATTTIPNHVRIEDLYFRSPPGQPNDSLAQLRVALSDLPGEMNYYRYLVGINGGNLETGFSSVEEDLFFDGKTFEFQLFNPQTTSGDVDPDVFGLYFVGDSVTVKWTNIDEAHFNFWNTLEFSNANQGPFASYTRLQSNIQGGLGIWGGYSVSYYHVKVEY